MGAPDVIPFIRSRTTAFMARTYEGKGKTGISFELGTTGREIAGTLHLGQLVQQVNVTKE